MASTRGFRAMHRYEWTLREPRRDVRLLLANGSASVSHHGRLSNLRWHLVARRARLRSTGPSRIDRFVRFERGRDPPRSRTYGRALSALPVCVSTTGNGREAGLADRDEDGESVGMKPGQPAKQRCVFQDLCQAALHDGQTQHLLTGSRGIRCHKALPKVAQRRRCGRDRGRHARISADDCATACYDQKMARTERSDVAQARGELCFAHPSRVLADEGHLGAPCYRAQTAKQPE